MRSCLRRQELSGAAFGFPKCALGYLRRQELSGAVFFRVTARVLLPSTSGTGCGVVLLSNGARVVVFVVTNSSGVVLLSSGARFGAFAFTTQGRTEVLRCRFVAVSTQKDASEILRYAPRTKGRV